MRHWRRRAGKWLLLSAVWRGRKLRPDPRWPTQEVPVQELSPSNNGNSGNNIRLYKASPGQMVSSHLSGNPRQKRDLSDGTQAKIGGKLSHRMED